jgi:3-methyladenine DNA glycosylase AlkD
MLTQLRQELRLLADPQKAKHLAGFFKTGKGQYGEGDIFCGVVVPKSRKLAVKYKDLPLIDVQQLLQSKIHEERLIALFILVHTFEKGDLEKQKEIYDFYLSQTKYINNWDLVDLSADKIVGGYLKDHDRSILLTLARSESIWDRRISIMATFQFIKSLKESTDTFAIADILLHDSHDLIQKAVGWMLREVGKRISLAKEEAFLRTRYKTMPRTMLRYAIEQFTQEKRQKYLRGEI